MRFSKLLHGFMSLFPCPSQKLERSKPHHWSCFEVGMEVVLVAMSPHPHPQQILFTKEEYWHKKLVQAWQISSKHSLDLEARVLDFKGAYFAHLLVFLSDSKNILLFKELPTNHFKSTKGFSCGRNLVKKKDYKSPRWIPNFPYVISNGHNLVNFYHLEPILFPQGSWRCELYAFFHVQSKKMDGSFLKNAKDYTSFHDFWPTSTSHNLLNFWRFWVVQIEKCNSRYLLHSIFFCQHQILSGRPCLGTKYYRSFLKKNLKYF